MKRTSSLILLILLVASQAFAGGALTIVTRANRTLVATWTALTESDTTPTPYEVPTQSGMSVEVSGTFGGGTIILEGTNNPAATSASTFLAMKDISGVAISKTTAGISQLGDMPLFIRPRATAGSGVSVNVFLYSKPFPN